MIKMAKRRRRKQLAYEFKPDPKGTNYLKRLYMTRLQRMTLLKWGTYVMTGVLLLVIQDVIMSQITIFGATTDLAVAAILLITVIEGIDVGSLFVLIASCMFYFSGFRINHFGIPRFRHWHTLRSNKSKSSIV